MGYHFNMAFVALVLVYVMVPKVHSTLAKHPAKHDCCCCNYKPKDCQDVMATIKRTGVYTIYPGGIKNGIKVFCDMHTAGGGWTVIQRRYNGAYSFYRKWLDYQSGFGSVSGQHWLGNLNIHELTTNNCNGRYRLRIDMVFQNKKYYAEYDLFAIAGPTDKFRLTIGKYVAGNAGDSLPKYHNGMKFSTYDQDNDLWGNNCAQKFTGAWWYRACHWSNLNGLYGSTVYGKGINWRTLTGYYKSLQRVQMAIRRN